MNNNKVHLDSARSVLGTAGATRGVVDFLVVLDKLLRAIGDASLTPSQVPPPAQHPSGCDCPFGDVRYAALWETVLGYQSTLHGRSPGTLVAVNVALALLQVLPHAHLVDVIAPSIGGPGGRQQATAQPSHASQRLAHQLALFYGKLQSYKRQLFRIHLNSNLLGEWIHRCPSLQLQPVESDEQLSTTAQSNVSAVDGGDAYAHRYESGWAQRHRFAAFDAAVLVFSVAKGIRHLQGLLPSVQSACQSLHCQQGRSQPNEGFDDSTSASPHSTRRVESTHPDYDHQICESMPLMIAESSLEDCVAMLASKSRVALRPLYRSVARQLLLSGDVPDAIGWLLCRDRLAVTIESCGTSTPSRPTTPSTPLASSRGAHSVDDEAVLLVLCNRIRSCQSAEMLTDFILWVSIGSTPAAAGADPTTPDVDVPQTQQKTLWPLVAAEYCIEQATEHCLALMISSQLILHECDGMERNRFGTGTDVASRTGQGIGSGTMQRCPMCHQQHPVTAVCEGIRQRVALAITESLISALVAFTEHLCSDDNMSSQGGQTATNSSNGRGIRALLLHYPSTTQQAALQTAVDLVVVATSVCQRFQSEPLLSFPVFSRTYNTERQLLLQQQAQSTTSTNNKHNAPTAASSGATQFLNSRASPSSRKPSFVLHQDTAGFLLEDLATTLTMRGDRTFAGGSKDDDISKSNQESPRMSNSNGNHSSPTNATGSPLLRTLSQWEALFLPTPDEKEVDGMYVLAPPVMAPGDVDMLRNIAVDNGGDVLRYSSKTVSNAANAPLDARRLYMVLAGLSQLMLRSDVVTIDDGEASRECVAACEAILGLSTVADRIKQLCLVAIADPTVLTEALGEMHGKAVGRDDPSGGLLQSWSAAASAVVRRLKHRPLSSTASDATGAAPLVPAETTLSSVLAASIPTSLSATSADEPLAYFTELCAAVEQAQELLVAVGRTDPPTTVTANTSPHSLAQAGLLVKGILDRYRSSLHGRAPSTLQQLSLGCGIAARLLREGRRRALRVIASASASISDNDAAAQVLSQQHLLVSAETDLVNRAVAYQKRVLVLSHLEPATRCSVYVDRGALCFSQSMWLSSAHQYAVAERILATRQDAVRLGFQRLKEILRSPDGMPSGQWRREELILRFQQDYGRVITSPAAATAKLLQKAKGPTPNTSRPTTPTVPSPTTADVPQQPTGKQLSDVLARLRYNAAVSLWSGGRAEDAEAWLLSALGTANPASVFAPTHDDPQQPGQLIQLAASVAHMCQLMQLIFSGDAVDGLLYFLGSLSSEVALDPTCIAGALVLTQNVLERYVSLRACRAMMAAAPGGGGAMVSLSVQTRHVTQACNHVVVQLSTGKIQDIQQVLRDGMPPAASHWDKLLVHAVVTCMNFCSAFPDSVWYEAAFHRYIVDPPATTPTAATAAAVPSTSVAAALVSRRPSVLEELSSPAPRPSPVAPSRSFWGTPREEIAAAAAAQPPGDGNGGGGFFSRVSKFFRANDVDDQRQGQSTTSSTTAAPPPSVDAFHVVRVFFDKDMKRAPHLLAQLCEWAVATPLVVIREDDLRAVSVQLDEAMLELQALLQQHGGDQEAALYIAGLRENAELSMRMTEAFAPPAAGFDEAASRLEDEVDEAAVTRDAAVAQDGGNNASGVNGGYSFACVMSPAVAAPKPSFVVPPAHHVDAAASLSMSSSRHPLSESTLSVGSPCEAVVCLAPAFVPEVTLDKLGATSASALQASRRAHVLGSVYSPTIPGVVVTGAGGGAAFAHMPESVLSLGQLGSLHQQLPMHVQLQPWRNIYSTQHHGTSYRTMLSNCEGEEPLVIVLEVYRPSHHHTTAAAHPTSSAGATTSDPPQQRHPTSMIGAYLPSGIRMGHQKYFGGADTFVFQFQPTTSAGRQQRHTKRFTTGDPPATTSQDSECVVYRWSRQNDYFLNCRMDYLAVGGGAQGAAIYFDDSLSTASTSMCATFGSPPLVPPTPGTPNPQSVSLSVAAVEVYAVGAAIHKRHSFR